MNQMEPTLAAAGYALSRLYWDKKTKHNPSMKAVLGFESGVYVIEFHWRHRITNKCNHHVVAVNCNQRRVFCNRLGVIVFSTNKQNEMARTHKKVCKHLYHPRVCSVYHIVQKKNVRGYDN